jgi:hypothetical protein
MIRSDNIMMKTETPKAPNKPDGTLIMQINNQTFITEIFFNHDSKETFQDKLLRVILAEDITKQEKSA